VSDAEERNSTMRKRMIGITAAAAGALLVAGGTVAAFAVAGGDDGADGAGDSSTAITGTELEQATAAAVAAAGPGTVTESEAGGDEAAYEIELQLDAGGSVDVRLDEHFNVVGVSPNNESANDTTQQSEPPQGDGDGETADD
jgi:hypothetical protein